MIHRKILKGLLLLGSLLAGQAYALGLGNITLQSNLNEPLAARIQLVSAGNLSPNEVLVNLAPQEDFDKAMVERSYLLNGLEFRLDFSDSRNPAVIVTTSNPIREPFLDFIVELRSPSGRVLREYTVLLDIAQGGVAREPMRRPAVVVKRAHPQTSAIKPPQPMPSSAQPTPAAPVASQPQAAVTPAPIATDVAADAAAKAALAAQLAGAQEQASRVVAENEALKKQATDLEKQLADATAQLNHQNAQLQTLKAELDAAIAAKQAPAPAAATSPMVSAPQPAATVKPEAIKSPVPSEPVAQPESGNSWGTVLTAVVIVLLIAVGLWGIRKRQQQGTSGQAVASITEDAQKSDIEVDAALAQFGAEHSAEPPQDEAAAPAVEEKSLTTDEALDLLLADTDFGLSETPAVPQEADAPLVEELAVDDLLVMDDAPPVAERDDWSVDTVSIDTAPIDKDFVFEPELFEEPAVAEVVPDAEPVLAQQEVGVDDDAFHSATDRDFVVTKLELARQYLEMSDAESARDLLQEVLEEGDEELKQAATDLLKKIS